DPIAFPAWFRTHVVRAALRAARRRSPVISIDVVSEASRSADVDAVVEQRMLGRVFDTATLDDRVLLTLRYLWGTPVSEVAAVLGVPEGTVKSRTHAAMARLRAAYDAEARR
ncbi:MAG: sigma factor-like helix-turn-helix DNA-binding protein, partial [Candidatus Limnocylindrales bacterium]